MKKVTTMKAFKESLAIGQKVRLVKAYNIKPDGLYVDNSHKGLNLLREVAAKQSADMVFRYLEGEKEGQLTYLQWGKADDMQYLIDGDNDNALYGFRTRSVDSRGFGVALEYHFESEALC